MGKLRRASPLARVITVLTLLDESGSAGMDAGVLADKAGYVGEPDSRREMLKRDLRHLEARGWRIDNIAPEGASAIYRLRRGDPRIRLAFNDEEREQFARAAQAAGVAPSRVAGSMGSGAPPELRLAVQRTPAFHLELVLHAYEHRCLVCFGYHGRARVVSIDSVQVMDGTWYVVGRERGVLEATDGDAEVPAKTSGGQAKRFRLDKFQGDVSLGARGSAGPVSEGPVPSLDPLQFVDGPTVDAVVTIHRDHRAAAERALGRASRVERDGERLVLTIPVTSRGTFARRLLELDERVRLLGPPELRDELRRHLRSVAEGG